MRLAGPVALALSIALTTSAAAAGPDTESLLGGLYGGVGPADPLYTHYLVGGWFGVALSDRLRLELSGSYQDGLEQRRELFDFLETESLLDPDDALTDRTRWTAELLLRLVALRGKLAVLQTTLGGFTVHLGAGGGVRAQHTRHKGGYQAPTGLLAAGSDLLFGDWFLVRLDLRGTGMLRRDDTLGLGAELLAGVGARF